MCDHDYPYRTHRIAKDGKVWYTCELCKTRHVKFPNGIIVNLNKGSQVIHVDFVNRKKVA